MNSGNESALKPLSAEDEHLLEEDAVWDVLEKAQPQEASSFFSRDVMREIRLNEAEKPSLWARFFTKPRLLAGAVACAVLVASLFVFHDEGADVDQGLVSADSEVTEDSLAGIPMEALFSDEEIAEMQSDLEDDLMAVASVDPSVFYDQELMSYLY